MLGWESYYGTRRIITHIQFQQFIALSLIACNSKQSVEIRPNLCVCLCNLSHRQQNDQVNPCLPMKFQTGSSLLIKKLFLLPQVSVSDLFNRSNEVTLDLPDFQIQVILHVSTSVKLLSLSKKFQLELLFFFSQLQSRVCFSNDKYVCCQLYQSDPEHSHHFCKMLVASLVKDIVKLCVWAYSIFIISFPFSFV